MLNAGKFKNQILATFNEKDNDQFAFLKDKGEVVPCGYQCQRSKKNVYQEN